MKNNLINRLILLAALTFVIQFTGIANPANPLLKNGIWQGVIQRSDNNNIHFNFITEMENGKQILYIINANERLLVDEIQQKGDSLFITLPFFSSAIVAKIISGNKLQGIYIKKIADKKQKILFSASFGIKERYAAYSKPKYTIGGSWDVIFIEKGNVPSKAVGNFTQTADGKVKGSFLTPTGDYRYLEGIVSADTLKLSGFDGGFASLFTAIIKNDSTIENANFYSGANAHEQWTATKNEFARLPDEFSYSHLRPGETNLAFTFKDTDGKLVSIKDKRFEGKVVIVQILGSWCPNCMDETAFLSEYYKKNKQKGIEVIGLAYERTDKFGESKNALKPFQKRFGVTYPFLITGVTSSDPLRTEKTLPQIDHINAFPTTIFIDKKGNVRKIHTGFDGPGTGKFYEGFKKEFDGLINELVNEKN